MTSIETNTAALPYNEPGIVTILVLTSFLLLLNIVNHVIDKLLYCGLLGQIALGIAYGTPGANWLGAESERFIVNLGYLGLLLIVYEGGLLTSFKSLKANLLLSSGVAATGIALPIVFSYVLLRLNDATPLQAFAVGAALCSTSLGTTFAIMSASGLISTRMGVLLTSAAMMDDVVGLAMVQVISNLGSSGSSFESTTAIRPVFVSLAFAVATPVIARFAVLHATVRANGVRERSPNGMLDRICTHAYSAFMAHTSILVGMVTAATYAGTSGLFAAYLAGASITWWDTEVPHAHFADVPGNVTAHRTEPTTNTPNEGRTRSSTQGSLRRRTSRVSIEMQRGATNYEVQQRFSGIEVFETFYAQPLNRILKPFFFASIGFSIPVSRMFTGEVVWKGFVFTILMFIAKFLCGLWLVRIPWFQTKGTQERSAKQATPSALSASGVVAPTSRNKPSKSSNQGKITTTTPLKVKRSNDDAHATKPLSLYPGIIVGSVMVARGEIGFLISALAESNGIFGAEANSPIFLVVTWAIILCTIVGPILVGSLVKRVKRLQAGTETGRGGARSNVLGAWGVE